TRRADQTTKKTLYEQTFKTREYYWYDPFDPREFQGWQLHSGSGYQAMTPDTRGWIWSPALQLWVGRWDGTCRRDQTTWLRFYDSEGRRLWPSQEMAEAAQQQAERATQQAAAAEQRAAAERTRAEAAEAELARLRAELARLRGEKT